MKKNIIILLLGIFIAVGFTSPIAEAGKNLVVKSKHIKDGTIKKKDLSPKLQKLTINNSGHEVIYNSKNIINDGYTHWVIIKCPTGKTPTGGGFSSDFSQENLVVKVNAPLVNQDSWGVYVKNNGPSENNVFVYAVCINK